MKSIAAYLIAGALAALALFSAVTYVRALQAELASATQAETHARQGNTDRDATIKTLQDNTRSNELARAKLEGERNGIRQASADRELTFRRLLDENKDIRAWADTAMPGDVVRLREHGPFTGAQAYREAGPGRNALHPTSRSGAH